MSQDRLVRAHLAAMLAVTCVTAWFSYGYFHNDEYFQVIELTRSKLGDVDPRVLPWEHAQRMRPWLQPFLYWLLARALALAGTRDLFALAFVFRLVTGLANVGAVALFLRTTLPWMKTDDEKRTHARVVTMLGFLPYLFVRTSSESGSMAALTAAFALLLEGATPHEGSRSWSVPALSRPGRALLGGLLFGVAFEMRFQTAFVAVGIVAWLGLVGRASLRSLGTIALGTLVAIALGAFVDRWGYGMWTFPAWTYFQANVLEGAAGFFGSDPPFAYLWMLPANVFFPVVVAMLVLAVLAWLRCPRHPVTWATLPFFVVHNLIAHKEERFLFPMAVLSTAFVTMALGPSSGRPSRFAAWGWKRRGAWPGKVLGGFSLAGMVLLAFVPLGWHGNARFTHFVHEAVGEELHATALPEVDLNLPAFHPRVYDVDKADPEELVRRLDAGTARPWLIADRPILETGTSLDRRATLVYSELPFFADPVRAAKMRQLVERYNAHARPPLRKLRFRSLYRLGP
ncbi:MAG: Mannosyltransferase [Labilithrix sp.]|nr:Mannosyltransferase [Labilithrix sp.]